MKVKKDRNTSKSRANSRDKSAKKDIKTISDAEIDEIIQDITLKRPRNAYTHYVMEEFEKEKKKNSKITLMEVNKKCAASYKNISDDQKERYEQIFKEEKEKYDRDLGIVRALLIEDFDTKGATAYRLFLGSREKEALIQQKDVKEEMKKAREDWDNMGKAEKAKWNRAKKENDFLWAHAEKNGPINSYSLFVKEKIRGIQEGKKVPNFKEVAEMWKTTSDAEKLEYQEKAREFNEGYRRAKEMINIAHGIKPKRPMGAFKIFLMEKAASGDLKGKNAIVDGKAMFEKLSKAEKEDYKKKAHRLHLAYIYKKNLATKNMKKQGPSKPKSAFNFFVAALGERNIEVPEGGNFLKIARDQWNSLTDAEKEKYEKQSEKDRERYEKQVEKFQGRVYEKPPRAHTARQLYMGERLHEEHAKTGEPMTELMPKISDEWKNLAEKDKKKYTKKAEKEKATNKKLTKQFNENGFYVDKKKKEEAKSARKKSASKGKSQKRRTKDEDDDDEEEEDEKVVERKPRKSQGKSQGKSQKRKPSSSRGKTQGNKKK